MPDVIKTNQYRKLLLIAVSLIAFIGLSSLLTSITIPIQFQSDQSVHSSLRIGSGQLGFIKDSNPRLKSPVLNAGISFTKDALTNQVDTQSYTYGLWGNYDNRTGHRTACLGFLVDHLNVRSKLDYPYIRDEYQIPAWFLCLPAMIWSVRYGISILSMKRTMPRGFEIQLTPNQSQGQTNP